MPAKTLTMNKSVSKTVYTPVFYKTPQPSASASSTHSTDIPATYLDSLSRKHIALAQIVKEIPGEDEDPESNERVELLRKRVVEAFELANGDPADGKWALIVKLLRLGTTRGRSRWLGSSREGQTIASSAGWINANTESEWLEWERKWKEEDQLKRKVESWKQKVDSHLPPPSVISISDDSEGTKVEFSLVKGKAKATDSVDQAVAPKKASIKATGTLLNASGRDPRDPPALGFTVMKRSSQTLAGKPKHTAKPPNNDNVAGPSKLKPTPLPRATDSDARMKVIPEMDSSSPIEKPQKRDITNISETSFLPPSFPSQLQTSTPNDKTDRRQKPPPIPLVPSSSPISSPPSVRVYGRAKTHLDKASSLPELPTTPKRGIDSTGPTHAKRQRSVTPEQVVKKARTMPPLPSSGGMCPPSTPQLPATDDPASSPMVVTPKRPGQLPTLKELLASSKKAKLSPKKRANAPPAVNLDKGKEKETSIERETPKEEKTKDDHETFPHLPFQDPFLLEDPFTGGLAVGLGYDAASPTKSLSSLAESDSDSDEGGLNMNFMNDIDDGFDPPFTSTQAQGKDVSSGLGMPQGGGFGWMRYSSQFDVNGKVDQVSKFMEKDVDYDGWLRDPTPEIEESQE